MSTTFCFIVVLGLYFQVVKADLKATLSECIGSMEIPSSDIALLMEYKIPESNNGKCTLSCILVKLKYFNEDGTINKDNMEAAAKEFITDQPMLLKSIEILDTCIKEQSGTEKCSKGASAYKCLTEKHLAAGFRNTMDLVVAKLME